MNDSYEIRNDILKKCVEGIMRKPMKILLAQAILDDQT